MLDSKDIITIKLQRPPITIKKADAPCVRVLNHQVLKPLSPEGIINLDSAMSPTSQPRKRQRLDHLSMEEKILRRKMRNREAAQTARDRKKAFVDELQSNMKQLQAKNAALQTQFLALQAKYSQLQKETEELRSENMALKGLGQKDEVAVKLEPKEEAVDAVVPGSQEESAELNAPQQRELRVPEVVATMASCTLLYVYLLAALTFKSSSYSDSSKSSCRLHSQRLSRQRKFLSLETLPEKNVTLKWWGRHQRSWNPAQDSSITIIPFRVNCLKSR